MSNRTPKEALREIRNRIVYIYGNIDGTFNPPALKEVCEIADDAISSPITEKSSAVGNAAAMREGLIWMKERIIAAIHDGSLDCSEVLNKIEEALSAPPRQCDVGTAEEQVERFREFCETEKCMRYRCGSGCKAICIDRCAIAWAQTPYKAEEGGADNGN